MIFSENRCPSPIAVEDMLFGIVLKGSSDGSTARHFLDQIDDAAAQLAVLDAHEGLRQRQPVAGRKQAGGIIRGIALGKTGVHA